MELAKPDPGTFISPNPTVPAFLCWLLALFLLVTVPLALAQNSRDKEARETRLTKAEAMFHERCKTAGEKIYRTAENVEGIFLVKLRPPVVNYRKQFEMDDPYGSDFGGDAYIKSFLRGHYEAETSGVPIAGAPPPPRGYHFVEAVDPLDGKRYRYTGALKEIEVKLSGMNGGGNVRQTTFVLVKSLSSHTKTRYAVTYDDISTREEREYWIAGSSLKIIDLNNNQIMAERIGYMMDRGQGNTSGGRAPWLSADDNACPTFQLNPLRPPGHGSISKLRQTERFAEKVLKPRSGK